MRDKKCICKNIAPEYVHYKDCPMVTLFELAEKYCQHNDKELNNCLYYIFKPFMEKVIESTKKDMMEKCIEVLLEKVDLTKDRNMSPKKLFEEVKNKIKDIG